MPRRQHTRDHHEQLGRELRRANAALVRFICSGPTDAQATKTVLRLHRALREARSHLDTEVVRISEPEDLSALRVYFGRPD